MIVGIVGLGLIGGSLAKAYKRDASCMVYGYDKDYSIGEFAKLSGTVDMTLTAQNIKDCDLVLLAVYPEAAIAYLEEMSKYISSETVVIDCLGTKKKICDKGFSLAEMYGYTFVGGHPMAGSHNSGFKYSSATLFDGAPMVIVPPKYDDIFFLDKIEKMLKPVGFGSISVSTAEDHDRIIAFTSQLAHIVSNAYIKSPTALSHKGVSAGSYKDLTRVAWLNPEMWTELFLENSENLIDELEILINNLNLYRDALKDSDKERLIKLLDEGRNRKKEVDG